MSFAKNLKKLRNNKGITQKKLGKILDLSRNTIAGYENEGKEPKYDILIKIAEYFQCTPNDLLDYEKNESIYQVRELSISKSIIENENLKKIFEKLVELDSDSIEFYKTIVFLFEKEKDKIK